MRIARAPSPPGRNTYATCDHPHGCRQCLRCCRASSHTPMTAGNASVAAGPRHTHPWLQAMPPLLQGLVTHPCLQAMPPVPPAAAVAVACDDPVTSLVTRSASSRTGGHEAPRRAHTHAACALRLCRSCGRRGEQWTDGLMGGRLDGRTA
jgi:hypothetical protein